MDDKPEKMNIYNNIKSANQISAGGVKTIQ